MSEFCMFKFNSLSLLIVQELGGGGGGGSSLTIVGANSNLHQSIDICLKFQKNDVCHSEFSCGHVFYRPDRRKGDFLIKNKGLKEILISCDLFVPWV